MRICSNQDFNELEESKYAVVVAAAKRARHLAEINKDADDFRLSAMVSEALEDIFQKKINIKK